MTTEKEAQNTDALLKTLMLRYMQHTLSDDDNTTTTTTTVEKEEDTQHVWLSFHECVFGFPKAIALKLPYIQSRLARWDGKLGLGHTRANPIVMGEHLSLDRFLRVYNCVKDGKPVDEEYKDDFLYLGLDVEASKEEKEEEETTKTFDNHIARPADLNAAVATELITTRQGMQDVAMESFGGGFAAAVYIARHWLKMPELREVWRTARCHVRTDACVPIGAAGFGRRLCFDIPTGDQDLLSHLSLSLVLPALPKGYRWHPLFARRLLQFLNMHVGGHDMTDVASGESNALLAHVHGMPIFAESYYVGLNDQERARRSQQDWQLDLPVMLPMTRFKHLAFPLFLLEFHLVRIDLRMALLSDLIERDPRVTKREDAENALADVRMVEPMYLLCERVRLATDVAAQLRTHGGFSQCLLQWQFTGDEGIREIRPSESLPYQRTITLRFNHPISGVAIMFKYNEDLTIPEDVYNDMGFCPFIDCTLLINGDPVLYDTASRMRTWQWQRCGLNIPTRGQWYLMPFSPSMFAADPHVTTNMSRIDNASLRFTLNPEVFERYPAWHVEIAAPTFNEARYISGMMGLRFSN